LQGNVMAGFPAKGVTAKKFPREILRQLRNVTEQVLSEEARKDADFARIWASQKKFSKTYQLWKDHAYLPRDF
jgi:TRAP-type mannitol/chloroaromatic compound transport system substrate-binding protein